MDPEKTLADNPSNEDRRNFLKLAGTTGLTVAVAAVAAGTLGVPQAEAQTAKEEAEPGRPLPNM